MKMHVFFPLFISVGGVLLLHQKPLRDLVDASVFVLSGKSEHLPVEGVGHICIVEPIVVFSVGHSQIDGLGLLVIFSHPVFLGAIRIV